MTAELVPVEVVERSSLVTLVAPLNEIVHAQRMHAQTCEALLDADDYQNIGPKTFKKKSAWRKLGVAYSVSHEILSKEYWYDDDGHIRRAEFVVRATAPNGRFEDGVGLCDVSERSFGLKQDHDVPATAHTRAINRASSDLFGLGEVSAEEVDAGGDQYQRQVARQPVQAGPAGQFQRVERGNLAPATPPKQAEDTEQIRKRLFAKSMAVGMTMPEAIEDALGEEKPERDMSMDECKVVLEWLIKAERA